MRFCTNTPCASRPKKRKLPGRAELGPEGVGSVRDSTSESLMPVSTRKLSCVPRIG
jgi:hypothetical protein